MDALIDFGRGPLFRFAIAVALLGLLRHVALGIAALVRARRRAGDRSLAVGQAFGRTVARLNFFRYFRGRRGLYSVLSVIFHVGLILVPILYLGHVRLWRRGLGIGWPALPAAVADGLTLATMVLAALLLVARAAARTARSLSGLQDWTLPFLIGLEFLSGYFLAHPGTSPIGLGGTMLVHVWVGDLLLLVTPFTKIAHCALLPLSQFVVELAWRFVPGSGQEVEKTLGKEGQAL